MTTNNKPCIKYKYGAYPCYWFVAGKCTVYKPSVKLWNNIRVPEFVNAESVPQEFCKEMQIVRSDIDSWHNRNIVSMRYEDYIKITKTEEREVDDSGSTKTNKKISAKTSGADLFNEDQ